MISDRHSFPQGMAGHCEAASKTSYDLRLYVPVTERGSKMVLSFIRHACATEALFPYRLRCMCRLVKAACT